MQEHPSTKSKTYKYVYELNIKVEDIMQYNLPNRPNKWRQFLLSIRETFKLGA